MGVPNNGSQPVVTLLSKLANMRTLLRYSAFASSAVALFSWSQSSLAARYIVQLNSPSLHRSIASRIKPSTGDSGLRSAFFNLPSVRSREAVRVPELGVKVEDFQKAGRLLTVEVDSKAELQMISNNPNIAFFEKETFFKGPDPVAEYRGPQLWREVYAEYKEIPWGLKAIKSVEAWNINPSQAMMGQNARVLVLDTGIDKNHQDLSARFEKGRNFMEKGPFDPQDIGDGEFNLLNLGLGGNNGQREFWEADFFENDYDYFDTNGHGSHVSGTIAATLDERGVVGVAPQARILTGRVCGGRGCSSLGIVQGIYWGIEERVDVINMSLGGANPSRATAEAVKAADDAGVIVVAASGNDGEGRVSFPAAHPESIAVGAVSPFLQRASFSNYGPELTIVAPGVDVLSSVPRKSGRLSQVQVILNGQADTIQSSSFKGSVENPTPLVASVVHCGLGRAQDIPAGVVKGKIALIARGEIKFSEKVANALNNGAIGVLIYNNTAEGAPGGMLETPVQIPVAGITQAAGVKLAEALGQNPGLQASIAVLPSDYQAFSGTSMATPHVAGLVALMKSANKNLRGADVKAILRRTAHPMENKLPNENGAGLVDAELAVREAMTFKAGSKPNGFDNGFQNGNNQGQQLEFNFGRP